MARIVLLNGVGSAGKSSLAQALQEITAEPFLHVAMDAFFEMLPKHLQNDPATFSFTEMVVDGQPAIAIRTGEVGDRLMRGMRRAILGLADTGNNLIIDDVILDDGLADYRQLLAGHELRTVGVFASLEVLEAREKARGDRLIGLARWQFSRVHHGRDYDLSVLTDTLSPMEAAAQVRAHFSL